MTATTTTAPGQTSALSAKNAAAHGEMDRQILDAHDRIIVRLIHDDDTSPSRYEEAA